MQEDQGGIDTVSGFLWQCLDDKWLKKFIRVTGTSLRVFPNDEAVRGDYFPLTQFSVREVSFSGPLPPGVRSHSTGFLIIDEGVSSPRGVTELRGSCQDLQQHDGPTGTSSSPRKSLILAAEDAAQHRSWIRALSLRSSSSILIPSPSTSLDAMCKLQTPSSCRIPTTSTTAASFTDLPPAVLRWLGSSTSDLGKELIARLHAARTGLLSTFKDITFLSSDPLHTVTFGLNQLQACLLSLIRCLHEQDRNCGFSSRTSSSRTAAAESLKQLDYDGTISDAEEIMKAHAWLQAGVSFVSVCTTTVLEAANERDGIGPGSAWEKMAANAASTFQSAEDALLEERLKQKRVKLMAEDPSKEGQRVAVFTGSRRYARPAAKPYTKFWARKITV